MANIKVDASLLNMATIPEQQQHLKGFLEGEIHSLVKSIETKHEEEPPGIKFTL